MEYKWIAQDRNGCITKYENKPDKDDVEWFECRPKIVQSDELNWYVDEWESSLINLETHDYKIEDGILIKVEKENPKRHKHADLMIAYANDRTLKFECKQYDGSWYEIVPSFEERSEYRIKPKTKTVRFRNYLGADGRVYATDIDYENQEWIGDWIEVEVDA